MAQNETGKPQASGEPEVMEKIVSLCKRRGFVFQSSEIYGGLKSCYDYGPLGAELKRNVKAEWWRTMVHEREDIVGIDASIIMHPKVWQASGHLTGFADPLVDCRLCREHFRADQAPVFAEGEQELVISAPDKGRAETWLHDLPKMTVAWSLFRRVHSQLIASKMEVRYTDLPARNARMRVYDEAATKWKDWLEIRTYRCPVCGSPFVGEERRFNLMFRASLGSVDPIENIAKAVQGKNLAGDELKKAIEAAVNETAVYLRPETAQAMFVNFLNVQAASRLKPPFGIAQQGKSFRNEITVEHFTYRSCEFEQMEMEFFVPPPRYHEEGKDDMWWFNYWCEARLNWYVKLGMRREKLRLRAHEASELAHYAKACKDIEYEYPWGWGELEGIAHRTDYDLKAHEKASGKKLTYFDPDQKAHYHPFVIEPAAGADRAALAFLLDAYTEEPPSAMRKDGRVLLKLHPRLAPLKVAVFPLVRKDGMPEAARKIVAEFYRHGINAFHDEKDAVGRRYARQDEAGTPYCLTVDGQTAQDETVTIRERDSMKQERIKVAEAVEIVRKRLAE